LRFDFGNLKFGKILYSFLYLPHLFCSIKGSLKQIAFESGYDDFCYTLPATRASYCALRAILVNIPFDLVYVESVLQLLMHGV